MIYHPSCPQCGAELEYDDDDIYVKCDSCGHTFYIDDLKNNPRKKRQENNFETYMKAVEEAAGGSKRFHFHADAGGNLLAINAMAIMWEILGYIFVYIDGYAFSASFIPLVLATILSITNIFVIRSFRIKFKETFKPALAILLITIALLILSFVLYTLWNDGYFFTGYY